MSVRFCQKIREARPLASTHPGSCGLPPPRPFDRLSLPIAFVSSFCRESPLLANFEYPHTFGGTSLKV